MEEQKQAQTITVIMTSSVI